MWHNYVWLHLLDNPFYHKQVYQKSCFLPVVSTRINQYKNSFYYFLLGPLLTFPVLITQMATLIVLVLIPLDFLAFKQPGFLKSMKIEIGLSSTLINVIFTNLPDIITCSGVSHIGINQAITKGISINLLYPASTNFFNCCYHETLWTIGL